MNLRKTAIALAVAGTTVAAPMAAQAEGSIYASARIGLENVDTGGVADFRTRSFGSRFGVKGETDLGNGMTGFGKYEWDVDFTDHNQDVSADAGATDDIDIRHRIVGLKGDFGKFYLGQTYHTFYNFVVGPLDIPWWASGYAMINYRGRTDHGITYEGGTGDIKFGVTGYFGRGDVDEDAPDQLEVGASFGIGDMTLGLGLHTSESAPIGNGIVDSSGDPESVFGVTLSGISLGGATLGVGFMSQEDDSSVVLDLGVGNAYVHVETESLDAADQDPTLITLGYTQSLGRNTTAWYEFVSVDADTDDSDDDTTIIRGVLKYDIL